MAGLWGGGEQRSDTERVRIQSQQQAVCVHSLTVLLPCMQLFTGVPSVPSVPSLASGHPSQGSLNAVPAVAPQPGYYVENTLDESVWETLKRDLFTIGRNLRSVLIPVNWDFGKHQAALHNWDLWGPLVGVRPHYHCHIQMQLQQRTYRLTKPAVLDGCTACCGNEAAMHLITGSGPPH